MLRMHNVIEISEDTQLAQIAERNAQIAALQAPPPPRRPEVGQLPSPPYSDDDDDEEGDEDDSDL
jgi:hypothetical protein